MRLFAALKGHRSILSYPICHHFSTSIIGGVVYSKGVGVFGCLGHGNDLQDKPAYSRIKSLENFPATNVLAAMGHSAVVLSSNELLLFGRPYEVENLLRINRFRVVSSTLARFVNRTSASSLFGDLLLNPTAIDSFDEPVKYLRSVGGFNIILSTTGRVYTLGSNRWENTTLSFQRIRADADTLVKLPEFVSLPPIIEADVGLQHCVACTEEGTIYTWGAGERGQLGDNRYVTDPNPIVVQLPSAQIAVDVRAGFNYSCALTAEGRVYVWGKFMSLTPKNPAISSAYVSLFEDQGIPRAVNLPDGRKVVEICACSVSLVMRAEDDTLWIIGMAEFDRNFHAQPLQVCNYTSSPPTPSSQDPIASNSIVADSAEPIILPNGARLKRGHTRVSIIYPKPDPLHPQPHEVIHVSPAYMDATLKLELAANQFKIAQLNRVYDIVLSEGIAFLIPIDDLVFQNDEQSVSVNDIDPLGSYSIVDYSQGWQHNLLILKEDDK